MVTHPAPPQTRTCAMRASGSSSRASATRRSPRACSCQGWCAQSLSPSFRPWDTLLGVACPPVGPLGLRSSPSPVLCDATTATMSLSGRCACRSRPETWPAPVVRARPCGLVTWGKHPGPRQGLWSPGPPLRACGPGDRWLSHVPAFPLWRPAPLADPGGVLRPRPPAPRTAAFPGVHTVGSPRLSPLRGSLTRSASSLHPAPYGP